MSRNLKNDVKTILTFALENPVIFNDISPIIGFPLSFLHNTVNKVLSCILRESIHKSILNFNTPTQISHYNCTAENGSLFYTRSSLFFSKFPVDTSLKTIIAKIITPTQSKISMT